MTPESPVSQIKRRVFAGIVGAVGYIATGYGYLSISLPPLIMGALIGAWVGALARNLFPEKVVRWGFAVLMVAVAVRILAGTTGLF